MFGNNIKKIRMDKGLGVNELSRLSGVNASYISALERDEKKNPSVNILEKLAAALNVTIDELMKTDNTFEEANENFKTAEEAMQFILKQKAILGFGGFKEDLSEEDIINLANDLLEQYKLLSYKYTK